nr:flavodoxin [Bacteroides intestinalis]
MKKYLYLLLAVFVAVGLSACSTDSNKPDGPQTEVPTPTPNPDPTPDPDPATGKTLIVYYSFTNNVHTIVSDLQTQIEADVVRVEPAEEGLDYAANNYAIGSALIQAIRNQPNDAASYPAIKPVEVNIADYDRIIIGAPLWWSNMAAPLQTFLFQYGNRMGGKSIGLIVSSASSGISSVESDAKRLIPEGNFLTPSLWIRSSQTSNCHSLIAGWLNQIN